MLDALQPPFAASACHVASLPSGDLSVRVDRTEMPLEAMCGFAARRNPKRGFLFVSRVLGRHLPVRPSTMRATYRTLAAGLPRDLPGPVLFVGMAETAVCLGTGVFDEWTRLTGRTDAVFSHTTRYAMDEAPAFVFREEHSHATGHIVHMPRDPADAAAMRDARTLVLVDDEASTGRTFGNFVRAARGFCTRIEQVACAVLTDWSAGRARRAAEEGAGVPVVSTAILHGEYSFAPRPCEPVVMPDLEGNGRSRSGMLGLNHGRFGIRRDPVRPAPVADALDVAPGTRTLVLGSGEFVWAPFRLAEELEARGVDAWVQATTRSPIMVGNDVGSALTFRDSYGDGIENYLYNALDRGYERVLLCQETPRGTEDPTLVAALRADAVCF